MTSERLATRVGLISLAVIGAAIIFFVFVWSRIEWGTYDRVRVYFHRTGGLKEGAPLVAGGRTIGRIESISLAYQEPMLHGDDGIAVTVAIDRAAAAGVSKGGDVFVASRGALSERYLEVGPAPEPGTPFRDGDKLAGSDPPSLDAVMNHTWQNMLVFEEFQRQFQPKLAELRTQIDTMTATFDSIANELPAAGAAAKTTAPLIDQASAIIADVEHIRDVDLGGERGLASARALGDHVGGTIARARAMVAELRGKLDVVQASVDLLRTRIDAKTPLLAEKLDDAIARGKAALDKIEPMLAVADEIADRLRRGEGTVGKIANDPEFPEDAKDLGKILKREPWRVVGHPQD